MSYLRVRNWERYQHYKDRKPPWIKFYVEMLDEEAHALTDRQFGQLTKLFLLAARRDNAIPNDPAVIAQMIGTPVEELELDALLKKRYLVTSRTKRRRQTQWPSRYISKPLREQVLARDEYRCVKCSASVWLEIDHIVPVSAGGRGDLENLQTLCRSCNRAKRTTDRRDLRSKNVASVLPETEKETYTETPKPSFRNRSKPEASFRDPSAVCRDCGESLGAGHLEDCPVLTRHVEQVTTLEQLPERTAVPAAILQLLGQAGRPTITRDDGNHEA